jgi:acyl-CoA thioester hydrolase
MERGRTEWLRALGIDLSRMAADNGCMFVAKSVSVDYLKPARLDDMLTVRTNPKKLGFTFIDLNQDIFHGSMQLTQGAVRIVCVDTQSLKPCALPRQVVNEIKQSGPSA